MSFAALHNRGDYFSPHYLDARLQQDLSELRERWAEREAKGVATARAGLKGLSREFFAAKTAIDGAGHGDLPDTIRAAHDLVLAALGFASHRHTVSLQRGDDELLVPVAHATFTPTGLHLLALDLHWATTVDHALDATADGAGGLLAKLEGAAAPRRPKDPAAAADAISLMFATDEPPRFVLALAGGIMVLADRLTWAEGRFLAADLDLALDRKDTKPKGELETLAALFSADALVPDGGTAPIEALTAGSQKHAVGVSKDLREGVRQSIELIANEVIVRRLERNRRVYDVPDLARQLTSQALRYLYRIIVLLYAESRPEIGVLPTDHPEYGEGYGLDRLRSLVLTPIVSEQARNGTHLFKSLEVLFRLVNEGYQGGPRELALGDSSDTEDLRFSALQSQLFAARSTQLIDEVNLGNACLQQVLALLMLSKEQRGRERGFVSYAQLGINQIGAVYEGLMAYTGFFAAEDLFEVCRPGKEDKGTWTLPVSAAHGYADDVFVTRVDAGTGLPVRVRHAKGTFVFRLSGRDRQRSASYYTPEVLTRCVVKHALAELLTDETPAERILSLSVCEPALGSGAFLNEAINQLADEYLRRRQAELGEAIDPDHYQRERQKVRAHIALHNAYGVDLNATAVELAEVSLWLNSLTPGVPAPWFGLRLRRGNSLIGARRATYAPGLLAKSAWKDVPPTDRPLSAPIEPGEIHHFLLPAHGWGAAGDAAQAKELRPDAAKALREWRKAVLKPPPARDVARLQAVAAEVEVLWQRAAAFVALAGKDLRRPIDVWGAEAGERHTPGTRDTVEAALRDPESPLGRLRLVMDAWCALWFWPLDGPPPPSLAEWIATLEALVLPVQALAAAPPVGQQTLFAPPGTLDELLADELERQGHNRRPVHEVVAEQPWLTEVRTIAEREGFHHWELEFAPVFANGGFDLVVGNPPWVRPTWDEAAQLAEFDARFGLGLLPTTGQDAAVRPLLLADQTIRDEYLADAAIAAGTTSSFGSTVEHPALSGVQVDLFHLFVELAWRIGAIGGVQGLVHQDGHMIDPKAMEFRRRVYERLRRCWLFINEELLFEIEHNVEFGVHIYTAPHFPSFMLGCSFVSPGAIDGCLSHDGSGLVPTPRNPDGSWSRAVHRDRIVRVDRQVLAEWSGLVDRTTGKSAPRLLRPVSVAELKAISRLSHLSERVDGANPYFSDGLHETNATSDGTIRWAVSHQSSWRDVILSGPHVTVSTPFELAPRPDARDRYGFAIRSDLETLHSQAIPVTAYQFREQHRTPNSQQQAESGGSNFQLVWRAMTRSVLERSLHAAVVPAVASHVGSLFSVKFERPESLVMCAGLWSSLPFDYIIKVLGLSNIKRNIVAQLPLPVSSRLRMPISLRAMRLNCLTSEYASLWSECSTADWKQDGWAGPAHTGTALGQVGLAWTEGSPLRTDYDRRKALVELDALAALVLGLSHQELCAIYVSQFPVLRKYEFNSAFSANGRRISKDHQVAGYHQQKGDWELALQWFDDPSGTELPARYTAPLWRPDREAEMTTAWHVFADRYGRPDPLPALTPPDAKAM